MPRLTPNERLEYLDDRTEALKSAFLGAAEELDQSDHIPAEVVERLQEQAGRIAELPDSIISTDLDPEQLDSAWRALWQMRELLDRAGESVDLDTLDGLLVAVERFRHVIRDALDEYVPGLTDDRALVVGQIRRWLPGIPKAELADLLDIDVRTLSRWEGKAAPPPHRLALLGRLVGILRHAWTPAGVVAWFSRSNRELDGRRPIELLDKPEASRALISAARATRSMYGT